MREHTNGEAIPYRVAQLEESESDHEQRIRRLEGFMWKAFGAAAAGAFFGGGIIAAIVSKLVG